MASAKKKILLSVCCLLIAGMALFWWASGQLFAPRSTIIGAAPLDLHARPVSFSAASGDPVHGWWIEGARDMPSILLLHGIRSDRRAMLGRARLLASHGYSVLLFDLRAHGESAGDAITFGWLESESATAAQQWLRSQRPRQRIGAIGVSLGGAAILLGPLPSDFDAVVLEAVYSDVHNALRNRLDIRLGALAPAVAPLLEMQIAPRLGISVEQLSPIDRIDRLDAPLLLIAGGRDRHTRPDEARAMYARARAPKHFWLLPEAAHQDFLAHSPDQYEHQVIGFLDHYLRDQVPSVSRSHHAENQMIPTPVP